MKEIFVPIKDFELYEISNTGKVKSLPKGDGNGNRERILKYEVMKNGLTNYHRVSLSKNGKVKRFFVHRLVAEHFIKNYDNKPFVNHIDNNGENNNVNNLEWCTHSENMIHSQNQGRLRKTQQKAGIISGEKKTILTIEKHNNNIGKVFGNYRVDAISTKMVKSQYYYVCTCLLCNRQFDVVATNILRGVSTKCRSCASKIRQINYQK